MKKWIVGMMMGLTGMISFCSAEEGECDDVCNKQQDCKTGHVQLYYSGSIDRDAAELREEDYEWPARNEDAFYDFFTR